MLTQKRYLHGRIGSWCFCICTFHSIFAKRNGLGISNDFIRWDFAAVLLNGCFITTCAKNNYKKITVKNFENLFITKQTRLSAIVNGYKKPDSMLKNIEPGIANV